MKRPGGLVLDAARDWMARAEGDELLRIAPLPRAVFLPMSAHLVPLVGAGDAVRTGQPIARPRHAGDCPPVHAPISGQVQFEAAMMRIDGDGRDERWPELAPIAWREFAADRLSELLAEAGLVGLGGAAFPTHRKCEIAHDHAVTHLVLNGVECEPYIACDDALMRAYADDVVLGAEVLAAASGAEQCTIAVEADKPAAVRALQTAIANARRKMAVVTLPTIYPMGGERQLVTALTGREVPAGGLPTELGLLCQNVATAAAAARWVREGEPLIRRIVTVTGAGIAQPCNLEVRIGTPLAELVECCGGYRGMPQRLIVGGSMMGLAAGDDATPVTPGTNCIIVATGADLQPRGTERACIRCGDCAEACPAGLLPQQLWWAGRSGDDVGLDRFGLEACIECGCCDHVCPSQIPLTSRFVDWKRLRASAQGGQGRATRWHERFEAHTRRRTELEQDRQARLAARRRGEVS